MVEFSNLEDPLWGTWQRGEAKGQRARLIAYRAGGLATEDDQAQFGWGAPEDFVLESGQTAAQFLKDRLSYPSVEVLRYGTIREAIASAHLGALHERWEGLLNFSDGTCYVDNQSCSSALLRFDEHGCIGVVRCKDPWRTYDLQKTVLKAPVHLQGALLELTHQHEVRHQLPLTGLFWSEGGMISAPESLYELHPYGFELLEPLLLADGPWSTQMIEDSEADPKAVGLICSIASRYFEIEEPVELSELELARLFPPRSSSRKDAMEAVMDPKFAQLLCAAPPL